MRKKDELANPDSCLNKARDDEFLFVLLERDPAFARTLRYWAGERIKDGLNNVWDSRIAEALTLADEIDRKPVK